jgi:hypothetical protein
MYRFLLHTEFLIAISRSGSFTDMIWKRKPKKDLMSRLLLPFPVTYSDWNTGIKIAMKSILYFCCMASNTCPEV